MFLHSRKPIGVRDGPQAENQKVKFESVRMMIEAMGNNHPLLFEINLVHFPCQEVHTAQHFANRIHNCREIQIAGRDFVKHWHEQKKFSRLISVISTEGSRASFLSNSMATVSPAKPPPTMSIRFGVLFSMGRFSRPRSAQPLGSVHTNIRFLRTRAIARRDAISCAVYERGFHFFLR